MHSCFDLTTETTEILQFSPAKQLTVNAKNLRWPKNVDRQS